MKFCSNCSGKTKGKGIKYHRFPKNPDLTKEWSKFCGDEVNLKRDRKQTYV